MKFTNRTIYNKDRLLRFNDFVILKKRFFLVYMIVCSVLILISTVVLIALDSFTPALLRGFLFFGVVVILYFVCGLVVPRFTINKSIGLNADVFFEFQDDVFKISTTYKNGTEMSELKYSSIIKIMESKSDIYLFISARQSYILDKTGFELGSVDEFLNFLKDKNVPYKR